MAKNTKVSSQSHDQAMTIAKGTQKPGQSKDQTKLIAAGIEKGIAQHKKLHKAKMREQDKQRKKASKHGATSVDESAELATPTSARPAVYLPWLLLLVSWLGFALYFFLLA